jgi:2-phospho-L-lactate guanylyltransferase
MTNPYTTAIIPVRLLPTAKHRLSTLLEDTERKELVQAMLEDVLDAAENATTINDVIVVTNDVELEAIVRGRGHDVFPATEPTGLNRELTEAIQYAEEKGAEAVVIILADLPLLTGDVLDQMIEGSCQQSCLMIAQDWRGKGTNILYLHPPSVLELQFGLGSLTSHLAAAQEAGVAASCFAAFETALDLDDPDAAHRFLRVAADNPQAQTTRTYRVLSSAV